MKIRPLQIRKRWYLLAVTITVSILFSIIFYSPNPPPDAPSVLVSVDRTMWHRLGFNRLTYIRALRSAGFRPVVIDFTESGDVARSAGAWLDGMHALVLSGGGDVNPALYNGQLELGLDVNSRRDSFELALLAEAQRRGMPILGICRGAQLINVFSGGELGDFRADTPRYKRHHGLLTGHSVVFENSSRLSAIFGTERLEYVISYHGQYVSKPGENVRIVARSSDGIPEAIEVDTGSPFGMLGVQWHAEVVPWDSHQHELFLALRRDARKYSDSDVVQPHINNRPH